MTPDLGRYAVAVLSAYGTSLALLAGITWISIHRWRRLKAQVESMERGRRG